jgi:hypothetical protein
MLHKLRKIFRNILLAKEKLNNYFNNGKVISIKNIETLFLESHVLSTIYRFLCRIGLQKRITFLQIFKISIIYEEH